MLKIKHFKSFIRQTFEVSLNVYAWVRSIDKHYIRIEEINTTTQEIVVHSPGMRTILKLSIAEAIGDPNILCRLIPIQACWLGYYSSLSPEECKGLFVERKGLLLRFKKGRYKMLSLDRKGMISFLDARTNTTHTQRPVSIAQDPALISSFDPSQACYIGMLAGIDRLKGKPSSIIGYQAPKLRLVK